MSEAHDPSAHPPAEEDVVPTGKIVLVAAVALAIFFLGSLATAIGMQTMRRRVNPEGPIAMPAEAGKAKIGMVEQRLFENANQGVAWREQARRHLASWGWVDEKQGLAHIPIERAMELVEKGARP